MASPFRRSAGGRRVRHLTILMAELRRMMRLSRELPPDLFGKLVVVDLDDVRHRHIIDHALDARRAGHKRILHIRGTKQPRTAARR